MKFKYRLKTFSLLIFIGFFTIGCASKFGIFQKSLTPHKIVMSDGYQATYYSFKNGNNKQEPDTILFFIKGSEHASLSYYIRSFFKDLGDNVKVFALEKRYIKPNDTDSQKSSNTFHQYNYFSQWVKDQKEFIGKILRTENISGKKVVIFGFSEGGNVAVAVASKIPQTTHLVIVGSGGMKGIDVFRIWGKKHHIDFDNFYKEVQSDPSNFKRHKYGQTYKYWASVLPVEPMKYLKNFDKPIIVAIGEKDENTPVESVYYLKEQFEKLHKNNLTVKIFSDCNHNLKDLHGKSHKKELFNLW